MVSSASGQKHCEKNIQLTFLKVEALSVITLVSKFLTSLSCGLQSLRLY